MAALNSAELQAGLQAAIQSLLDKAKQEAIDTLPHAQAIAQLFVEAGNRALKGEDVTAELNLLEAAVMARATAVVRTGQAELANAVTNGVQLIFKFLLGAAVAVAA